MYRAELKKAQVDLDSDPNNAKLREVEMIFNKAYREAALDEERVSRQKAKVEWLKEGNHNCAYFHNLLKGRMTKSRIVSNKIDEESDVHMIREVFVDEIKSALFDIDDDKAPRPDGFTSKFFKASWSIVGKDLCDAVKEFFKSGKLL
ncbi:hypothetical protein Tco_0847332, partial [Tanacetum coccineum]